MPKVSVIIPAYNAMAFLPSTLKSISEQTFTDYEVIVVNDGSSDGIENWITQNAEPKIKLISQQNQGAAGAKNTGLTHAQGEYIAFLDADDLWEKTKLEKQVRILEDNPEVGLVYTWVGSIDEHGRPRPKVRINNVQGDVWEKLLEHNIVECGSVALVRRQCYEHVGWFDQSLPSSYGEDWDMWLRISVHYLFKVIQEPLVSYRAHSNNLSKNWTVMEKSHSIIIEKVFQSAPENRQYLKGRCYGFANLRIAWKILQSFGRVHPKVLYFQRKAVLCSPQLIFSQQNVRLSTAIFLVCLFKFEGYSKSRNIVRLLTKKLSSFWKIFTFPAI